MNITMIADGASAAGSQPTDHPGRGSLQHPAPHTPRAVVWHRQTAPVASTRAADQADRVTAWLTTHTPHIEIFRDDATSKLGASQSRLAQEVQ